MFEWLDEELATIHTPRFHLVDRAIKHNAQLRLALSTLQLPKSYKNFALRFGNAQLYRRSRIGYCVGLFINPGEETLTDGTSAFHIGYHDGAQVFLEKSAHGHESAVFEIECGRMEKVAQSFEEWLFTACERIRLAYGVEKWDEIIRGPAPFNSGERCIVEARRQFVWDVVGVDADRNHIVRITNNSKLVLPVLTIGVRSKDGRLNGAVRLKVGDILPGETREVRADCYKGLVPENAIELFSLSDPLPEDREQFQELSCACQ